MSEPSREVLIAMIRRARVMVIDQWEGAYGYVPPDEAATIADAILALRAAKPERERVIAQAICCPQGCRYEGDSEDGSRCYCNTTDYNGSGIERKAQAVVRALKGTPA